MELISKNFENSDFLVYTRVLNGYFNYFKMSNIIPIFM